MKRMTILLLLLALVTSSLMIGVARAEDNIWALCKTFVNIRERPSTRSQAIGYLDCGDGVETDWEMKNGWLHCINLSLEMTEGWVYAGYMIEDKPEVVNAVFTVVSDGRVALRKEIGGKRKAWAKPGKSLKVLWRSNEWSLTNKGYIRSEFLEAQDDL